MKIVADKVAFYTNVGFIVDYIKKFFAENGTPINVAPISCNGYVKYIFPQNGQSTLQKFCIVRKNV